MLDSLDIEMTVRLYPFVAVLGIMVLWEAVFPRRVDSRRLKRWPANFGIFLINVIILLIVPVTAVAAAIISIEYKFGLFFWVEFPFWPKVIFSLLFLDAIIYWQHRLFHMFKPLWRIHRMHHTDNAFDVTTALRFHPIEIFLSVFVKAIAIILIGVPVFAVVLFEIILNGAAMFNHSNIRMPIWLDRIIRFVIVTPDMHRVHHSIHKNEHDYNFGFFLSIWDWAFQSYRHQPKDGHEKMVIGLNEFDDAEVTRIDKLLTQPFRNGNLS